MERLHDPPKPTIGGVEAPCLCTNYSDSPPLAGAQVKPLLYTNVQDILRVKPPYLVNDTCSRSHDDDVSGCFRADVRVYACFDDTDYHVSYDLVDTVLCPFSDSCSPIAINVHTCNVCYPASGISNDIDIDLDNHVHAIPSDCGSIAPSTTTVSGLNIGAANRVLPSDSQQIDSHVVAYYLHEPTSRIDPDVNNHDSPRTVSHTVLGNSSHVVPCTVSPALPNDFPVLLYDANDAVSVIPSPSNANAVIPYDRHNPMFTSQCHDVAMSVTHNKVSQPTVSATSTPSSNTDVTLPLSPSLHLPSLPSDPPPHLPLSQSSASLSLLTNIPNKSLPLSSHSASFGYPHPTHTSISDDVFPSFTPQAIQRQANIIADFWPVPDHTVRPQAPQFFAMYDEIKRVGLPNAIGARVQVHSGLNLSCWDSLLHSYHDREICLFFRFGWPVGFHASSPPVTVDSNHQSALQHLEAVEKFVAVELTHGALVGPFSSPPFSPWYRCSPLMTRPKRETNDRRVIVDLSYPKGSAVNDGIDNLAYFGTDISYTLPSIGDLVQHLISHGRGALVWKADLARAYRQLRVDPLDSPLLVLKVRSKYYIDRCPSFGCRTSSTACQRMSNAVVYLMAQAGHTILAYLDDFTSCHGNPAKAWASYNSFLNLAKGLGLILAEHKCVSPSTTIQWLGYAIDTNLMTVAVPFEKLRDLLLECKAWSVKKRASKCMIQALAGRMLYVSNCIRPARRFTTRVLATLRAMGDREWTTLSPQFHADVAWFYNYAAQENGVFYYVPPKKEVALECDSSLLGAGGVGAGCYYEWVYHPSHIKKFPSIVHLEAINLLVTYKTFAPLINDPAVLVVIYTDNLGSALAVESGRTRDDTLANCSRELWLEALSHNHTVTVRHKPGIQLILPDALSRCSFDQSKRQVVDNIVAANSLVRVLPSLNNYKFFSFHI